MELKRIEHTFSVCKVKDYSLVDLDREFTFISRTDEENSLVCPTECAPCNTIEREDGWMAFRIQGILDFSLIGILSGISKILADNGIGIFAVSTFNTDYIFVKEENFQKALDLLTDSGHEITRRQENDIVSSSDMRL